MGAARETARTIQCLSNKRQIGLTTALYQNDHGNRNPTLTVFAADDPSLDVAEDFNGVPARTGINDGNWPWHAFLLAYAERDLMMCPANAAARQYVQNNFGTDVFDWFWPWQTSGYGTNGVLNEAQDGGTPNHWYIDPDFLSSPSNVAWTFDHNSYVTGGSGYAYDPETGVHGGQSNFTHALIGATYSIIPGVYARATEAQPHSGLSWHLDAHARDLNQGRHPGISINTLYHDGHADNRGVATIYDADVSKDRGDTSENGNARGVIDLQWWGIYPDESRAVVHKGL